MVHARARARQQNEDDGFGKQEWLTKSEQELRSLRKKQEAVLNELASNLPIWKLCECKGITESRIRFSSRSQ